MEITVTEITEITVEAMNGLIMTSKYHMDTGVAIMAVTLNTNTSAIPKPQVNYISPQS